ncbi:MAG: leucine-rich repeat domain-containing protein, partial [Eubacterium sp.]
MKKAISLLLSVAIIVSSFLCFSTNAYAASGTTGDLSWNLDTSTGVFTLSGSGYGANYANSFSSRAPWYTAYRTKIKSVIIESGVKGIGDYSFYSCTNLTSVSIADSVDTIGSCCFRSCTSLTNITLPENCSWYYKELFLDCTSLKWAIMPTANSTNDYLGKLPDGTFSGCTSLEEVFIGSGHTSLDTKAFY